MVALNNFDLMLYNGRIYPQPSARITVQALAVWKGRVAITGSSQDILSLRSRSTKTVNLEGRVVLPGFADSHIHLLGYGMLLRNLNLSGSRSIEEIKRRVAKAASTRPKGTWILGRGWDHEKLQEERYPNRRDLDEASSNPVFLRRICGHVAVANSPALLISRIDRNTADPEGGVIVKDSQGEPSGILKERAIDQVQRFIPRSEEETRAALVSASRRLVRLGLTSLQCIIEDAEEFRAIRSLKDEGKIPQSIYAIMPSSLIDHLISSGFSTEKGEDALRLGGVKVYLDGSLGARTAALTDPYADDADSSGMLTMSHRQLSEVAIKARKAGFQLCIHAIGDRAVELAIKTLEEIFGSRDCRSLRHRIEHSSLVSPRLISKMGKLGIVASVQPRFIYSDSWANDRLGPNRTHHLYPFFSMVRAGIPLAAGSDCPTEDPNPLEGIWSAVVRPGSGAEERLTVDQALAGYTTGASYASFSEDARGTLDLGNAADMVILDKDPFESRPEDLRNIRVVSTIIGGEVVA